MKVYSVIVEQVEDCATIRLSSNVFSTKEKANDFFKRFVEDESKTYEDSYDGYVIEKNSDEFTAYLDGHYCEFHSYATIVETDLDSTDIVLC
jgi:hypothetical protein